MPLHIARILLPIEHRADWERGHLSYVPKSLYTRIVRSMVGRG